MPVPARHPDVATLAFLLGTWRGSGRGDYPTIDGFVYEEEVVFSHSGKPFLGYRQRTWDPHGAPLHSETGYLRAPRPDQAELVVAQPTGIAEIHTGTVSGTSLQLAATHVGVSPTAKHVAAVTRTLSVEGDTLTYRLEMAAVGQPLQFHLEATLDRVSQGDETGGQPPPSST